MIILIIIIIITSTGVGTARMPSLVQLNRTHSAGTPDLLGQIATHTKTENSDLDFNFFLLFKLLHAVFQC